MNKQKVLNQKRARRARRVRFKFRGTSLRPRLSVFRANRHIYAQIIDDLKHKTLVSVSSLELVKKSKSKIAKTKLAGAVGELLAEKARSMKIKAVQFDRGQYLYHGRVKALAEAARAKGLEF